MTHTQGKEERVSTTQCSKQNSVKISARELVLLAAILLLGALARGWDFPHIGLTHFDEGPYTISARWMSNSAGEPHLYEKQHLFAPPVYFFLVSLAYLLSGGPSDLAAIGVNVFFGSLTILLLWSLVRRWLGPEAAIASATLLAFNEYLISLSRVALTDTVFGFLFLLALACIIRMFETGSYLWAGLSGLTIGIAWNTKYHGWFAVVIALTTLGYLIVVHRIEIARARRLTVCCGLMSAVALACYIPWMYFIQTLPGGYSAFAKYQKGFVSLKWPLNMWRQMEMQWFLDGWLSRIAPGVACLSVLMLRPEAWKTAPLKCTLLIVLVLAAGLALSGIGVAVLAAIWAVKILIRQASQASFVILSSVGLWFFMTPMYRPYGRLLVPLVLCTLPVAAFGLRSLVIKGSASWTAAEQNGFHVFSVTVVSSILFFVAVGAFEGARLSAHTWMRTDSLREAVRAITRVIPRDAVVYVLGAPEVAFYFQCAGYNAIPLDFPPNHVEVAKRYHPGGEGNYLITGVYARRTHAFRSGVPPLLDRLTLVGKYSWEPGDVRLLDDFKPRQARIFRAKPTEEYDLSLYKLAPARGTEKQVSR